MKNSIKRFLIDLLVPPWFKNKSRLKVKCIIWDDPSYEEYKRQQTAIDWATINKEGSSTTTVVMCVINEEGDEYVLGDYSRRND